MRALVLLFLLFATTAGAADTARLLRQINGGSTSERIATLRELAAADPATAVSTAIVWLQPGSDVALASAAARVLGDLEQKAGPAEAALRARLNDPNPELAYPVVGALAVLGVPKADLRPTRLRLARAPDRFIAFYSARGLYPDTALGFDGYLRASFGAIDLMGSGRPSNPITRNELERDVNALLDRLAKNGGRPGFDALLAGYPSQSPRVQHAIASVLDAVPVEDGDPLRIAKLLDDAQVSVRRSVTAALADYHEAASPVIDKMLGGLQDPDPDLRAATASALGRLA